MVRLQAISEVLLEARDSVRQARNILLLATDEWRVEHFATRLHVRHSIDISLPACTKRQTCSVYSCFSGSVVAVNTA